VRILKIKAQSSKGNGRGRRAESIGHSAESIGRRLEGAFCLRWEGIKLKATRVESAKGKGIEQ
jgi:hypothetical protein